MRCTRFVPVAVAVLLWGCVETAERSVTEPDASLRFAKPIASGPCAAILDRDIKAQQLALFNQPYQKAASDLWSLVVADCPANRSQAREAMLVYVQFTIDQLNAGHVNQPDTGTAAGAVLAHWNLTFPFVDYPAPNLPGSIFGPDGAARVITQASAERELRAANAAITVPVQDGDGDARGHLFTIHPASAKCLTGTNLRQYGPCFDFSSFPEVDPAFSPKVKVGVCQGVNHDVPLPLKVAALGHLTGGFVKIPEQRAYPTFCAHPDEIAAGSWTGGIREFGKRVAWVARRTLGVRNAYAVHGGLGGLGGKISPFGAVDLMVFQAPLGSETIGTGPATPDVGIWTSLITPPGSITLRGSLGNYADTIIVLSQGGGNCNRCGGLLLQGNLADSSSGGTGATTGIYRVRWVSLQDGPTVKGAPFVTRDSNGREIARLNYATKSSKNLLHYNGVEVGTWVQHQPQTFVIDVNMDTKKTTLTIDGIVKVTDANFAQAATSFRQFAADFRGIDSGIMGWAEVSITRLEDK